MTCHAIVIGIDQYASPHFRLEAGVADAIQFATWALTEGAVAPDHLKLLLGTDDSSAEKSLAGHSIPVFPATRANINEALGLKEQEDWHEGDRRLYVYFGGHGFSHPVKDKGDEPVLVPADVVDLNRDRHLLMHVSELVTMPLQWGPVEQYFFLDACRDFEAARGLEPAGFRKGRYTRVSEPEGTFRGVRQWVFSSTAPGLPAHETNLGIFTPALIRALKGDPAAVERISGHSRYKLTAAGLHRFLKAEVRFALEGLILEGQNRVQSPRLEADEEDVSPTLREFTESEISKVALRVRVKPPEAREQCQIELYSDQATKAGPVGPPLRQIHDFELWPNGYEIRVSGGAFGPTHEAVTLDRSKRINVVMERTAGVPPQTPASRGILRLLAPDRIAQFLVTLPGGESIQAGGYWDDNQRLSVFEVVDPKPGVYRARLSTPLDSTSDLVFAYPNCGADVRLPGARATLGPEQRKMLEDREIATSGPAIEPDEAFGPITELTMVSLLGLAAYAAYSMDPREGGKLRAFGLQEMLAPTGSIGWVTVLVASADRHLSTNHSFQQSLSESCAILIGPSGDREESRRLLALGGYPAGAQAAWRVANAQSGRSVSIDLLLPNLPVVRFAAAVLPRRVTVVAVSVDAAGRMESQLYFLPIWSGGMGELNAPGMQPIRPTDFRYIETAQRFHAAHEPIPDSIIEALLIRKLSDPMLGLLAGYSLVRKNRHQSFRGDPIPAMPAREWNFASPMQNMLNHFGALPDSHVLAGLCEPERKEEHFAEAIDRGVPLFAEGVQILAEYAKSKRPPLLAATMRSLLTDSALTVSIAREPVLKVSGGRFQPPSLQWSRLELRRATVERVLTAVGLLYAEVGGERRPVGTAFLIGPTTVLTANHVWDRLQKTGGDMFYFSNAEAPLIDAGDALRVVRAIAIDAASRLAVLQLADSIPGAVPLELPPSSKPAEPLSERPEIVVLGYPSGTDSEEEDMVEHAFRGSRWVKCIQPGRILTAPSSQRNFDHTAFTLGGSAGSPVIGLTTGQLLGVHWGGLVKDSYKRGRATALWKNANRMHLP